MSGKAMMMSQPFLKPNERLIILADLDLMEFPLELLQVFHNSKSVAAISRDFSLHFFATRFNAQKECKLNQNSQKETHNLTINI